MEIEEIFVKYSNAMSQIYLSQRAVQGSAKKELIELVSYEKSLDSNTELKELSLSLHNMMFRIAQNGSPYFFSHQKISIDDKKKAIVFHKNKQYQWLLAEAYEIFVDFVEEAYAFAGHINNNFWLLSDYGNISLSDIKSKNFEWFSQQAKKKSKAPESIFNRFREKLPRVKSIEEKNELQVNLRFAIVLIEHLRHIIVHKRGVVSNKELFIENVLKKSALFNCGSRDAEHREFIGSFFGAGEYCNLISILEVQADTGTPLNVHFNIFEMLCNYLMAYAHFLTECLSSTMSPVGASAVKEVV